MEVHFKPNISRRYHCIPHQSLFMLTICFLILSTQLLFAYSLGTYHLC